MTNQGAELSRIWVGEEERAGWPTQKSRELEPLGEAGDSRGINSKFKDSA